MRLASTTTTRRHRPRHARSVLLRGGLDGGGGSLGLGGLLRDGAVDVGDRPALLLPALGELARARMQVAAVVARLPRAVLADLASAQVRVVVPGNKGLSLGRRGKHEQLIFDFCKCHRNNAKIWKYPGKIRENRKKKIDVKYAKIEKIWVKLRTVSPTFGSTYLKNSS